MSWFSAKWYLLLPFFRCLSIRAAEGTRTSGEMAVNAQKEPRFLCVDFFIKQAFMNPHIYANFIQFWPSERFCFSRGINPLSVISLDVLTVLMHTNLNVVLSLSTVPSSARSLAKRNVQRNEHSESWEFLQCMWGCYFLAYILTGHLPTLLTIFYYF